MGYEHAGLEHLTPTTAHSGADDLSSYYYGMFESPAEAHGHGGSWMHADGTVDADSEHN